MTLRTPRARHLTIEGKDLAPLSAILIKPRKARACFVFAHGAGAGMSHPFMERVAAALFCHGIATLRFQFPFMEKGSRRPDSPAVAHAAVRTAVTEARKRCRGMLLIAGGKSFGGRMTSQAQAEDAIDGVRGLAFIGFPLHPAGKASVERAAHLAEVRIPMLFVQGTRDQLAEPGLLRSVLKQLRPRAASHFVENADHAFHVPARTGRTDREVVNEIALAISEWAAQFEG